jgi:hypothetical protein
MHWRSPNPEQAEDRLHQGRIVVSDTSSQFPSFHQWVDNETRRVSFLKKLQTYTPRRPRTYRDRKWLEGYTLTARNIKNFNAFMIPHLVTSFVNTYAVPRYYLKLTAESRGAMDAFLEAVGC